MEIQLLTKLLKLLARPIAENILVIFGILVLFIFAPYVIYEQPDWAAQLKLMLEVILVVGLGAVIAKLQMNHSQRIAMQQKEQAKEIANRQEYATASEHISNAAPAVRLKGVRDLYKYAEATNNEKIKGDIWEILHNQVKTFTKGKSYQAAFNDRPSGDIQEIINILTRREEYKESKVLCNRNNGIHTEWSRGTYLPGANFNDAQLLEPYFDEAYLQHAHFKDVKFQDANFRAAQLQGAYFGGANLKKANFNDAQLQGACFENAQLEDADFREANLQNVYFKGANLKNADFRGVKLQITIFEDAQVEGARFWEDQRHSVIFTEAQFQSAHFVNGLK